MRETCAELLARMGADKLIGPKVKIALTRFLPPVFADGMRDSPPACVNMFESEHEHPELIWDQNSRERICRLISDLRKEYVQNTYNFTIIYFDYLHLDFNQRKWIIYQYYGKFRTVTV